MTILLADDFPPQPSPAQAAELRRRQRGRNIALLIVLLAVIALFYAISIVKLQRRIMTRHQVFGGGLALVIVGMVGLSFASVPLYRLFCSGDRVWRHAADRPGGAAAEVAHPITIAMNADTSPQLPWSFAPEQRSVTMKLGEEQLALLRRQEPVGPHHHGACAV